MKRLKKFLIAIVLLGGLTIFCYAYYVWHKPAREVAHEKGIVITATALYDSFVNNEASANARFLNKAIQVTGIINNIKKNQAGETVIYLQTTDLIFGVNCTLEQATANISIGNAITFKGICTGFLNDVILTNGLLIQ